MNRDEMLLGAMIAYLLGALESAHDDNKSIADVHAFLITNQARMVNDVINAVGTMQ